MRVVADGRGGTVTRRSTSFSLVYGSAGGARDGASLIGMSVAVGTGVATSSSTNPPNDEPTAPATRLSPPARRTAHRPQARRLPPQQAEDDRHAAAAIDRGDDATAGPGRGPGRTATGAGRPERRSRSDMGLSTAAARGHRADCRTQREVRGRAASCRPACCCRGVRAETAGSLWCVVLWASLARAASLVPRAVNRGVRAGSRSEQRPRPPSIGRPDRPSVVQCRPVPGSCRLPSRLAPRPRRLRCRWSSARASGCRTCAATCARTST